MHVRCNSIEYAIGSSTILTGVSAEFSNSGVHMLLGPNGSGKSTLLGIIAGLNSDYSGNVKYSQMDIRSMSAQKTALHRTMCLQNLAAPKGVSGETFFHLVVGATLSQVQEQRAFELFDPMTALAVDGLLKKDCGIMSGGEFQRLYVAAAMSRVLWLQSMTARSEHLFLLDEPISNLDPPHQVRLLHVLKQFTRIAKCTTIAVVHDINLALKWSDKTTLLSKGSIVSAGNTGEVLSPEILSRAFGATFKPAAKDSAYLECDPLCELLNMSLQSIEV